MARGDVPVSLTLPSEIDKLINKLAQKYGQKGKPLSRREIVIQAVKLLAEESSAKVVKA